MLGRAADWGLGPSAVSRNTPPNLRGTFVLTRAALPHLRESDHAHVLSLSPPISAEPKWLRGHSAYTVAKYGMTMVTLGVAADEADAGIGANTLWPRTLIATAAVRNLLGGEDCCVSDPLAGAQPFHEDRQDGCCARR